MGRVANRIANASFTLDGKTYSLGGNDRCSPFSDVTMQCCAPSRDPKLKCQHLRYL